MTRNGNRITVLAFVSQDSIERGADMESTHCDTLKDARRLAKHCLTVEYMDYCESTVQLTYSQVRVNGNAISDYTTKGGK